MFVQKHTFRSRYAVNGSRYLAVYHLDNHQLSYTRDKAARHTHVRYHHPVEIISTVIKILVFPTSPGIGLYLGWQHIPKMSCSFVIDFTQSITLIRSFLEFRTEE